MRTITNVMLDLDTEDKNEVFLAGIYSFQVNNDIFLKISPSVTVTSNDKSKIFQYIHELEKALWELEEGK